MKYFLDDTTNQLYAYAKDGSQDDYIKPNLIPISDEEYQTRLNKINNFAFEQMTYDQRRVMEYPPITDYLDAIVKNDKNQLQTYINACLAVKEKYPKE